MNEPGGIRKMKGLGPLDSGRALASHTKKRKWFQRALVTPLTLMEEPKVNREVALDSPSTASLYITPNKHIT